MRRKTSGAVTLADIAKLSHVSEASVSAVLNGSRNIHVSAATRDRILCHARQLNYIPPVVAPSLTDSGFIAIWGVELFSPYTVYSYMIQKNLLRHGYDSIVAGNSLDSLNVTTGCHTSPEKLISMGARGIIFLSDEIPWERAATLSVPFALLGHDARHCDVAFNKYRAFAIMLMHLQDEHGKHRPLFVAVHHGWQGAQAQRELGDIRDQVISLWDLDGSADRLFEEVSRRGSDILVATNDHLALKLIKAATQRGIRVPEDLAVIGYDGLSAAEDAPVSLTTAMHSIQAGSDALCQLLYDRMAGRRLDVQHLDLPVTVSYGHSCGCPERPIQKLFTRNTFALMELDATENFNLQPENWHTYAPSTVHHPQPVTKRK